MTANYKAWTKTITIIGGLIIAFLVVATLAYDQGSQEAKAELKEVTEQLDESELFLNEAVATIDTNRQLIEALNNQLDGYTKVYANFIVVESDSNNLYIYSKEKGKGVPEAYTVEGENEQTLRIVLE